MKQIGLITIDLILATMVAIVGNIVATYLQERFNLTDPARFTFVAIPFVVCFVLLLFLTVKRSRIAVDAPDSTSAQNGIRIRQDVNHIKRKGKVTGVETDEPPSSIPSINVEQKAKKVAGKMTGVQIGRRDKDHPEK